MKSITMPILSIKNMVCRRCIMAVENVLEEMGIQAVEVRLGEVLLQQDLTDNERNELNENLKKIGFELLDDKNAALIQKIKNIIIKQIQNEQNSNVKLSDLIAEKLNKEYSQLSKLFSSINGITIEQFTILQKIEKAKELLIYDEMSLKEIAFRLNYSSSAHLSAQFKKITGLTPSRFRELGMRGRNEIDKI
ncbi:MAG: helix-turn-helix transcriptional regulator [Weeksellaceae bacterium]